MRQWIRWILSIGVLIAALMLGALAVGRSEERGSQRHSEPQQERAFELTYTARITDLPADGHEVRIWVPLAKTRENQTILSRRIRTPVPYQISREPLYGNEILYLSLPPPLPQALDIAIDYETSVEGGRRLSQRSSERASLRLASLEELSLNLRDEPFMVVNDTIKRLATETTVGQTTDLERAQAIYRYVIQHMSYDKTTPGWGHGDTLRACLLGKGNCTDFHSLFISMARSLQIPARFVIGATIPKGSEGEILGYHCWAEVYLHDYGWVPVDASEAWKHPSLRDYYFGSLDPNKLLISVGRNIQLVPAQAGPPVNIFIDPYVEVDGAPWGVVETRFRFKVRDRERKEERI